MRLTNTLMLTLALALPGASRAGSAAELRARGDALSRDGDLEGALREFEAARAAGDDSAESWKRIGWTQKALRRFAAAAASLEKAVAADPQDREAQDDLADLRRSRGLRLSGWLGGDEPGTSKQAVNAELWYGALDRLELKAGYGYGDAIFYESNKGYASAYWFYSPDSYLQADFTYREYSYPVELGGTAPNPDTSSYEQAPRGTLEVQHWFGRTVRGTLSYQLYAPTFWHDPATRIVNHKLTAEAMLPLPGGFRLGALLGVLRDPNPRTTDILNRPLPVASSSTGTTCATAANPTRQCALATHVVYKEEPLLGAFVGYDAARWGLEVKGITNRDLDASYAFSLLTTFTAQPADRIEAAVAWIWDSYANVSAFANESSNVLWASGRYWVIPSALALGGGVKWVNNPSPQSRTDSNWRNSATLLLNLEYRTGLF